MLDTVCTYWRHWESVPRGRFYHASEPHPRGILCEPEALGFLTWPGHANRTHSHRTLLIQGFGLLLTILTPSQQEHKTAGAIVSLCHCWLLSLFQKMACQSDSNFFIV